MPRQKKRMSKEQMAYLKTRTIVQTAQPRTENELDGSSSSSSDSENTVEEDSDSEDHSKCYKKLRYTISESSSSSEEDIEGYCIIDVQCLQYSIAQAGVCSVCKVGKYCRSMFWKRGDLCGSVHINIGGEGIYVLHSCKFYASVYHCIYSVGTLTLVEDLTERKDSTFR